MSEYYKIKMLINGVWAYFHFGVFKSVDESHEYMKEHWPTDNYKIIKFIEEEVYP